MNKDDLVWVEKYRPTTVKDCVLPDRIKKSFMDFVKADNFPNLLLTGGAGVGKTTIARALCNDLGYEVLVINASSERNIDTVKTTIVGFASTMSLEGSKKAIILDEADGLTPAAQGALRGEIEKFPYVKFILTCNFKNKLIDPLRSRTTTIEFNINKDEKATMMAQFFKRATEILTGENVKFDQKVVATVVKQFYPDNRRVLNELQRYAIGGEIDSGILKQINGAGTTELVKAIKERDVSAARQFVANNMDADQASLFRSLYDTLYAEVKPDSVPNLVILIAQYQYNAAFVADQEINTMALVCEIMGGCEFK